MTTQQPDSNIRECVNCHKRTTVEESLQRNYRTGFCGFCGYGLEPIQQPDPLDEIYYRCDVSNNQTDNSMSLEEFKSAINALMIPRKEVEAALKKMRRRSAGDLDSDYIQGKLSGYNEAISDIRSALNIKPESK